MKIIDSYKNMFSVVVNNPSITLFLVLFLIVSNFIASYMFTSRTKIVAMILSFCLFLLGLCFASGWLYILRHVIKNKKEENINYFPIFLEGIGKNIIPVGISSFIYTLLLSLTLVLTGKIASNIFGNLDFILKDLMTITQDNNMLIDYFKNLTVDQKYIIYAWQLSFLFTSMLLNFTMLFYFPAVIFEDKKNVFIRPFVALKNAVVFLFKNFFPALLLYLSIYVFYMFLSILKAIFMNNAILSIIILFIYIYFICVAVMLIFSYYGQKYNCSDRCDCVRENENIDKSSTKD